MILAFHRTAVVDGGALMAAWSCDYLDAVLPDGESKWSSVIFIKVVVRPSSVTIGVEKSAEGER